MMIKSVFSMFGSLLLAFCKFLLPVFVICAALLFFWFLVALFWFFRYFKEFRKKPKSHIQRIKKESIFIRLFLDAPKRYILDRLNAPVDFFPVSGVIIFEGMQGSGKTSSLVHQVYEYQKRFPFVKTITNFGLAGEDVPLTDWKQLIDFSNGYQGVICCIDELQNWFNSKQSKDFPPEMLSVVTQNRKNKRVILGTAQNFYMISKDIRTQCTEIRRCKTFLGCITFVHCVRPVCDSSGDVVKYKHIRFYFWIHGENERSGYDTYKCIKNLSKSGFYNRNIPSQLQ